MSVTLHDTLSRSKKPLSASDGKTFRFYCCGPTVYGPAHIGNFRTFIVQDVLRRVLEVDSAANAPQIELCHVRNITDVDDKTIRQSHAEGKSLTEFTQFWTDKFHADCAALNLREPHAEPKATLHIAEQVAMIEQLINGGHAYIGEDESVYFKVVSCTHYGELSHLDAEHLHSQSHNSAGEANDADEYERESVRDFALWKAYKEADGPNVWQGPVNPATGKPIQGRPGWHIECSAMSLRYLGNSFDLHGGGVDLCFPHHENEIAQSESATGERPFCHHWFHSAHLMVDGAKMSKSLGNLYTLADLETKGYTPSVVRYALLNGHYRQQLNFTENGLKAAASALAKLEKAISHLLDHVGMSVEEFREHAVRPAATLTTSLFSKAWQHLCDDLNVPAALGELFSSLKDLNDPQLDRSAVTGQIKALGTLAYALGIDLFASAGREQPAAEAPEAVRELAQARWDAKKARDFATADALRAEIASQGWQVLDSKDGFTLSQS